MLELTLELDWQLLIRPATSILVVTTNLFIVQFWFQILLVNASLKEKEDHHRQNKMGLMLVRTLSMYVFEGIDRYFNRTYIAQ